MSVAESGRRSYLFYNENDECCFKTQAVMPWAAALGKVLSRFPGTFGIYSTPTAVEHAIAPQVAAFILNDLNQ
jgi:hypothetical protein